MTYRKSPPEVSANTSKGLKNYRHHNNSSTPRNSGNTPVKAQGKIIGYLMGENFIKFVIGSRHRLKYPQPSWAVDCQAFDEEIKPSAREIVVIDKEDGKEYRVSTETFASHAFRFNRGHGDQYGCPIRFFETTGNGHNQLSLWGGQNGVQ